MHCYLGVLAVRSSVNSVAFAIVLVVGRGTSWSEVSVQSKLKILNLTQDGFKEVEIV